MNDRKEILKNNIGREIRSLKELNIEMDKILDRFEDEPDMVEMRAMGSVLHDFYCGVERIFERIAKYYEADLSEGENWHIELLNYMLKELKKGEGVINEKTYDDLKELLAFRHIFRNVYGFQLKWNKFEHLACKLDKIFEEFLEDITSSLAIDI